VDLSHRKLAHRGSCVGAVFVSPSTVLRVALKHKVQLPGEPFRARPVMPALPQIPWEKNRIIMPSGEFSSIRMCEWIALYCSSVPPSNLIRRPTAISSSSYR
jgi:hypothetical protein